MKNLNKKTIIQPFNYLPDVPDAAIDKVKKSIQDTVMILNQNSSFLEKLQNELIRNLNYSSRVSIEAFQEIHKKLVRGFNAYFDGLPQQDIFKIFDEDGDKYLHEDEQLLMFTVLIAKFAHILEEINFYGLYELDAMVRKLLESAVTTTAELEKNLRKKFYMEQSYKLQKMKENQIDSLNQNFEQRMELFNKFEEEKRSKFYGDSVKEQSQALERFNSKKSHFNFNKHSHLRNFIVQEKLLNLAGNNEEARNTYKNYQKFLDKEIDLLRGKVNKAFTKASDNYTRKQNFKHNLLENKLIREREMLKSEHRDGFHLLLKNLNVQENKLEKIQEKTSMFTTLFFVKNCKINQMKSEQALKMDFISKINTHLKSNFKQDVLHSNVFQKVFETEKLSLTMHSSLGEVIDNFETLKASRFNVRLSLRNFDEKPQPVNGTSLEGIYGKGTNSKNKENPKEEHIISKNTNVLRLTHLYDDHLNEINVKRD
jgi:hypothetical protein